MYGWYYEDYRWLPQISRVALSFKTINRITIVNPSKREGGLMQCYEEDEKIIIQLRY